MAYKIERSVSDHKLLVQRTLMNWNYQDHDLYLLSSEGHRIYTNKALLSFYSINMKDILNDPAIAFSFNVPSVSVPATFSCVSLLLKILVEGKATANEEGSMEEVTELADVLGIKIQNINFDQTQTILQNVTITQTKPKTKKPKAKKSDNPDKEIKDFVQQFTIKEEPSNDEILEENFEKLPQENKKLWECSICKKNYKEKRLMLRHQRRYHKDDASKSPGTLDEASSTLSSDKNNFESEEVNENFTEVVDTDFAGKEDEENDTGFESEVVEETVTIDQIRDKYI